MLMWMASREFYQGHAREVASSHDLGMYDGIVCISGDGVLVRSQGVLGCLYHFARGEIFFQCLVDDLGHATNFIR